MRNAIKTYLILSVFCLGLKADICNFCGTGSGSSSGGGGGSGIQSINGDTTSAQLVSGGTGVSTSTSGGTTTITNTAPQSSTAVTTIGSIDGNGSSADAATISGHSLFMQSASGTVPGVVNLTTQTMGAGVKTFGSSVVVAGTGDSTSSGTGALTTAGGLGVAKKSVLQGNVTLGSSLIFNGTTSGAITVNAGTTPASYSFVLPQAQGTAGTVLTNNGTGNLTWGAAGGGGSGVTTVGTIDSNGSSADGATISSTSIFMQSASATVPGVVNIGTQTLAGAKTLSGNTNLALSVGSSLVAGASLSQTITQMNGGIAYNVRTVGSSLSVDSGFTDYYINVNTSATPFTVSLSRAAVGRTLIIKDVGGGCGTSVLTIKPAPGVKIENIAASYLLQSNYGSVRLQGDGTNWWLW